VWSQSSRALQACEKCQVAERPPRNWLVVLSPAMAGAGPGLKSALTEAAPSRTTERHGLTKRILIAERSSPGVQVSPPPEWRASRRHVARDKVSRIKIDGLDDQCCANPQPASGANAAVAPIAGTPSHRTW